MNEQREHLLISRVIDGDCTDQEWSELRGLADADARWWRELALAQRDHGALAQALGAAARVAESVALPLSSQPLSAGEGQPVRWAQWTSWSGWAVAAVVTIVALVHVSAPLNSSSNGPGAPALPNVSLATQQDLWDAYIDRGTAAGSVIREVPTKVLLETRPNPSGEGYELVYLRQVLERATVPDLYHVEGQDEFGQPTLARYEQPVQKQM